MDVSRLSETLSWLRSDEENHKLQSKLSAVRDSLQNLVGSPGESSYQVQLSRSLDELESALDTISSDYAPADRERIIEIGGEPFFTKNMVGRIRAEIAANPMTPATVLADVEDILKTRKEYIDKVSSTESGVDFFIPFSRHLPQGKSDIGFELPRGLFNNDFPLFISELKTINRIVRVFSEVETGEVAPIELGPISSSDPLIFLQTPPIVIASIAGAVSWLLREWKTFEEIRKLRAETAKLGTFSQDELQSFFDSKIKQRLDEAVEEKTNGMIRDSALSDPRKAELDSELSWALKALFARIERGMRIEVRTSALPKPEDEGEESPEYNAQRDMLAKVTEAKEGLSFPHIDAEPILSIADNRGDDE